jgi:hypothetical protein
MALVIALMALGVGAFGLIVYQMMERQLQAHVESQHARSVAGSYLTSAYCMFQLYSGKEPKGLREHLSEEIVPFVNASIYASEKALARAAEIRATEDRTQFLLNAKNDLAYHLATRADPEDEVRARQLSTEILEAVPRHNNNAYWRDTALWVHWRYAGNPAQVEAARKEAMRLIDDPNIPQSYRNELSERYVNLL